MSAPADDATRPSIAPDTTGGDELLATVQYLVFEPGMYSLAITGQAGPMTELGVPLPCLRLEMLPATVSRPGCASLIGGTEGGWLRADPNPAFIFVVGGRAGALLTTYRDASGMAVPEIRLANVPVGLTAIAHAAGRISDGHRISLAMLAHVTGIGDVAANDGWLGHPGQSIEGFSLTPAPPLGSDDISYQAIIGAEWTTPWVTGGTFCGSRGLQLSILGFRLRLAGQCGDYECVYYGRFAGGLISGPHRDGEACLVGDSPLEAMQVEIRERRRTTALG